MPEITKFDMGWFNKEFTTNTHSTPCQTHNWIAMNSKMCFGYGGNIPMLTMNIQRCEAFIFSEFGEIISFRPILSDPVEFRADIGEDLYNRLN